MSGPRTISEEEAADLLETMALDLFGVQCNEPAGDTAIRASRYALLMYVMALKMALERREMELPLPDDDAVKQFVQEAATRLNREIEQAQYAGLEVEIDISPVSKAGVVAIGKRLVATLKKVT